MTKLFWRITAATSHSRSNFKWLLQSKEKQLKSKEFIFEAIELRKAEH